MCKMNHIELFCILFSSPTKIVVPTPHRSTMIISSTREKLSLYGISSYALFGVMIIKYWCGAWKSISPNCRNYLRWASPSWLLLGMEFVATWYSWVCLLHCSLLASHPRPVIAWSLYSILSLSVSLVNLPTFALYLYLYIIALTFRLKKKMSTQRIDI